MAVAIDREGTLFDALKSRRPETYAALHDIIAEFADFSQCFLER